MDVQRSSVSSVHQDDIFEEQEDATDYCKGGYHPAKLGQVLGDKYFIIRKLGWGQFSTVWLAWDLQKLKFVSIKIIKSSPRYAESAFDELSFLKRITENPTDYRKDRVIQMLDYFNHTGINGTHICMVFPVLGSTLLKLITETDNRGIGINEVKRIVRQILIGLNYLHDKCGIIHCDLKPENVLLAVSNDYIERMAIEVIEMYEKNIRLPINFINAIDKYDGTSTVKFPKELKMACKERGQRLLCASPDPLGHSSVIIADLGNACWIDKHFSDEIQTRQYRAPEVILKAGYNSNADIWSLGCLAYELATGNYLFNAHASSYYNTIENHIALITSIIDTIPKHLIISGKYKDAFNKNAEIRYELILPHCDLEQLLEEDGGLDSSQAKAFADFLKYILQVDPNRRPSAAQCLTHSWLQL